MDTKILEDTQKQFHYKLHTGLDKLSAAYIINHPGSTLGGTSVTQALEWSEDKEQDLFIQLVVLSAQFMGEHQGKTLDDTSLLDLIMWSGRNNGGN